MHLKLKALSAKAVAFRLIVEKNGMNRKTIIQIVIISICFGGAGLVLYNGLFKDSGVQPPAITSVPATDVPAAYSGEKPLPYGDDLKGELKRVLGRNQLQFDNFNYPRLDSSEVGIPTTDLVKPLPAAEGR